MQIKLPFARTLLAGAIALCGATVHADNIVEELSSRPEFSTLVTAVEAAGLVDALANTEDITVLAPSNDAFDALPDGALASLLSDQTALTNLLFYHVLPEKTSLRDFENGPAPTLLDGESVDVDVKSYFFGWFRIVTIDDSRITRADIRASNGVIHRINKVLNPEFAPVPSILEIAAGDENFSILADLVVKAGFDRALAHPRTNLTVFAPTNAAFEALGTETLEAVAADRALIRTILLNHLVRGKQDSVALEEAGSVRTLLRETLEVGPSATSGTGLGIDGKPIDLASSAKAMASNPGLCAK